MANKNPELYFIALLPPPQIAERVNFLKLDAKERYGTKQSLKSPPHITLHMPFKQVETKENELTSFLEKFSAQFAAVTISTKGIGSFPPSVLFVDVVPDPSLADMQRKLLEAMRLQFQMFNGLYKDLPFHPHMTFAFRDLRKAKFVPAWEFFKTFNFDETFIIEELTLLKHNGNMWEVFRQFPFSVHA